ncbi:5'-nucleotidase C-terminal domain-containing protein [Aestuariimicrobium soli]|uniref:5'-nucleotidase C-terminal domain-containing protein n=1 Tax=Aestuariimicrobium soli TaxID=2035834 RepID=UPI003EB6CDDC
MVDLARTRAGRLVAGGLASAVLLGTAGLTAQAAPALPENPVVPSATCTPDGTISVFDFNDFHGRTDAAARLFTPVEKARAAQGADNVLLLSAGDNIGGSTFVSASQDDQPTLDILKAAKVDAAAAGNHEFDKGWSDLKDRVIPDVADVFPYLAANVTDSSGAVPAPLKSYATFTKGGLTIGVVGAVTGDLPSLVSPDGLTGLTINAPVPAANKVADQLKDGDPANGEADIVIIALHEGAADGSRTAAQNAADAPQNFGPIYSGTTAKADIVINAHTHQAYTWTTTDGRTLVQAGQYGEKLMQLDLKVNAGTKELCSVTPTMIDATKVTADTSIPAIAAIQKIHDDAAAKAKEIGSVVIGKTSAPVTRGFDAAGAKGARNNEGALNNLVAQMFYETLANGNKNFIGVQNPGGTREDLDAGAITYEEAALVLPFANTLMTTEVTGAEFKKVLEEQWQRDDKGNVPSRPYLQLGLSNNVTYTYDESRAEGDRITSISVNGAPIDPAATYTLGSGSFLIAGGDNFRTVASHPTTKKDSGQIDLQAWVEWLKSKGTVSPVFAKQAVSITTTPTALTVGQSATFTVGAVRPDGVDPDTLDFMSPTAVKNTTLDAYFTRNDRTVKVGTAAVTDGKATLTVTVPKDAGFTSGQGELRLVAPATNTTVRLQVALTVPAPAGYPATGIFGDVTGDGQADLWQMAAGGSIDLWSGSAYSFTKVRENVTTVPSATAIVKVADVNGDGRPDALVRHRDNSLWLYTGNAGGGLDRVRQAGVGFGGFTQLFTVRGLGGGSNQYLVGRSADGGLWRFQITSTGLVSTVKMGYGWNSVDQIFTVGDFTGDRLPDVLAVRKSDHALMVYPSDRAGRLGMPRQVGYGWGGFTHAFSAGDVNSDGRSDLLGVDATGTLWSYTNRGSLVWGTRVKVATGFAATDTLT